MKEIENVELTRRNTQLVPMDLSAMGSKIKSSKKLFMVVATWREIVEKKTEYLQNNPTSGWSGTDDKTKASPARAKARAKACLARARAKERAHNTARKGRKDFTKWRGTKTNKKNR